MNQLNERLRILRIQIAAEKRKEKPDMETLEQLQKEEKECLKKLI